MNSVYSEQLSLYTLTVAGSGERKSAVFDILTKPLYEAETAYYKEHSSEIIASRLDYDDLKRKHNKLAGKRLSENSDYDAPWLADSEGGYRLYMDYKRELEPQLVERGGRFSHMREWGAKLAGNMLRIAGTLAMCDGDQVPAIDVNGVNGVNMVIDSNAVERAIAIADWYAANAEKLFFKKRRHSSEAQKVYDLLAQNGGVLTKPNYRAKLTKPATRLNAF